MIVTLSEKVRLEREEVSASALQRFLARARKSAGFSGEFTVMLTSDEEIRKLNQTFRGKDAATDVLSFPSANRNGYGGDIAISIDAARRQAHERGHSTAEEIKILMLHGMLHLAGMDHERDNGQMRRKESRLRRELKLPEGLIDRNAVQRTRARTK